MHLISVRVLAAVLVLSTTAAAQAPREQPRPLSTEIDRFVADYLRETGLRGAAVVVTKNADVVLARGYGSDSRGEPITAETRLPIASLSKSFTSLAVMQLVERGRVSLDAPVVRYLPEFSTADPRSGHITVRQVLEHTSGLSDSGFPEMSGPVPPSLRAGVALLKTATLSADPGTRTQYHNPNYWIAGRLVEVVSGKSFREYLQDNVFGPLRMRASTTVGSLREAPDVARGSVRFYGRLWSLPEPEWFLGAAVGVVTTADDLAKWLVLQNSEGIAANGTRVVSASSLRQMHDGLGWRSKLSNGVREVGHEGLMCTFTAQQLLLPQTGYGIAVVATRGFGLLPMDAEVIADEIARITRGQQASTGEPIALILEVVVGSLTVLSVLLALRAWRRAPVWASRHSRRPRWRNAITMLRPILPAIVLGALPSLVGGAMGGRDLNWTQTLYVAPTVLVWLVISLIASICVAVTRWRHITRIG